MHYTPLIISTLALLFTVFSFWWMNWRRGKLHIASPRSYAAKGSIEGKMILELPFLFFNNAPMPIIIQNLRVIFLEERQLHPLHFIATVNKLAKDEGRTFATQFAVRGREVVSLVCEFQREPGRLVFEAKKYQLELQAKIDKGETWKSLCRFHLKVSQQSLQSINKQLIAYDNMAED